MESYYFKSCPENETLLIFFIDIFQMYVFFSITYNNTVCIRERSMSNVVEIYFVCNKYFRNIPIFRNFEKFP